MNDFIESSLVILLLLVTLFLLMFAGWSIGVRGTLDKYCAAQQGIYERIDDVNYCIVNNQLFAIEWRE